MTLSGNPRPTHPLRDLEHHTCLGGRMRVTPEGLRAHLNDRFLPPSHSVIKTMPPSQFGSIVDEKAKQDGEENKSESNEPKPYIGKNLKDKQPPVRPLPQLGPNPYGTRFFVGDEFPRIMSFDRAGKPTWWSRFPEAQNPPDDITEMRISIATFLPDFVQGNTPQAQDLREMQKHAFRNKPLNEVFHPVDTRMVEQFKIIAKGIEDTFGIKMHISFDDPDAHLTIIGYDQGNTELLGFASFPPSVGEWEVLDKLGFHPAFMMINNEYVSASTDMEIHELGSHEFCHNLGIFHTYDYGELRMSKRDAITASVMAYTDLKMDTFRHVITDGHGTPLLDDKGQRQYAHVGADIGVVDHGLRYWTKDAPILGQVTQPDPNLPDYDGYMGVYDLQSHMDYAKEVNKDTIVYTTEQLLPMVPMLNNGKNTVIKGSPNSDFIDTNLGYSSVLTDPETGIVQRFTLLEGHMERVLGMGGDNVIVVAKDHDQTIEPGPGRNQVQLLNQHMQGEKTILSEGADTLVLTERLLATQNFTATQTDDGITLTSDQMTLHLNGNGPEQIRVINRKGRTLFEVNKDDITPQNLNDNFLAAKPWLKSPLSTPTDEASIHEPSSPINWAEFVVRNQSVSAGSNKNR